MNEAPETSAQVIDLMEALRASLEKKPTAAKKAARAAEAVAPAKAGAQSAGATRKPPKRVEPVETSTRKRAKG